MNIFFKSLAIIFNMLIPKRWRKSSQYRINKIKEIMTGRWELRLFWGLLFFPVTLPISLVLALIHSFIVLILPQKVYNETAYIFHELYLDVSQRDVGFNTAIKRASLRKELFSKGHEKSVSYGDKNADKTFFVIRPYYFMEANELVTTVSNLLFHYYRCLQHLTYAVNNDYIPVIDWQNYGVFPHQEKEPVNGTMDCWEYFWKQPSKYTLEEVYQSKNVILSDQNTVNYGYIPDVQFTSPFSNYVQKLAIECPRYASYFEFNEITKSYFEKRINENFVKEGRILGVCVRAMAYGSSVVKNHPIQPDMEQLKVLIRRKMDEWKLDYCFATCESQLVIDELRECFGEKLLSLPRLRYTYKPTSEDNILYEDGQKYQTNLDYLTEMYMLSKCTSIIGGMSSGIRAAIIWNNNNYENVFIFDRGNW